MGMCIKLCKLGSWCGAAKEFAALTLLDQMKVIDELSDLGGPGGLLENGSGEWFIRNLTAAVQIRLRTPEGERV